MKKIFSFKEFSKAGISEAVNPASLRGAWAPEELGTYTGPGEDPIEPVADGEMSLKREEFDVIVKPADSGGGTPPPPGTPKILQKGVTPPPGWKPKPGEVQPGPKKPGEKPGGQPKPGEKPGGQPKPGGKPGGQPKPGGEGGKQAPPQLPKVGDKVMLPSGRETTIKKVYPNGDIEV